MEYDEFVVTFVRKKFSRDVLPAEKAKIVAVLEAFDASNRQIYKSANSTITSGTKIFIPWTENLARVKIGLYCVDGMITSVLGSSWLEDVHNITSKVDIAVDIIHSNRRIGKLYLQLSSQIVYNKPLSATHPQPARSEEEELCELLKYTRPPGFRFQRLRQPLNWNRLKSLNIERVMESNDFTQVLSCLPDVTQGDTSQEDVDPRLHHALQLAQYTSQYLVACGDMLQSHTKSVTDAIDVFDEEEEALDMQLAKLRSRQKALLRETHMVDELTDEYTALVRQTNPNFGKKEKKRKHRRRISKSISEASATSEEEDTLRYLRMIQKPTSQAWESIDIPADRQSRDVKNSSQIVKEEHVSYNRPAVSSGLTTASSLTKPPKQALSIEIKPKEAPPPQIEVTKRSEIQSSLLGTTTGSMVMSVDSLALRETQDLNLHKHDEALKATPDIPIIARERSSSSHQSVISESVKSSPLKSIDSGKSIGPLTMRSVEEEVAESTEDHSGKGDNIREDNQRVLLSHGSTLSSEADKLSRRSSNASQEHKTEAYSDADEQLSNQDLSEEVSQQEFAADGTKEQEGDEVLSFRDMSLQESPILKSTTRRFEDHFPMTSAKQDNDVSLAEHDDIFGPSVEMSRSQLFVNENDEGDMMLESASMELSHVQRNKDDSILNLVRHEGVVKENTLTGTSVLPRDKADDADDMVLMGTRQIPNLQLTMSSDLSYPATNESEEPQFSPVYVPTFSDRHAETESSPTPAATDASSIRWVLGRAHIDEVETGCALDIYVSGIRLDTSSLDVSKVMLQAEFLNTVSPPSAAVSTSLQSSVIPVNYAAHIKFTRDVCVAVSEEIASQQEDICIKLIVTDENAQLLAEAIVNIWIMIEDEINIEVDICECDSEEVIGSAVVDVRGRYALMKCNS